MSKNNVVSFESLNLVAKSANGHTFTLKDQSGEDTGITMTVIGSNSDIVQKHHSRHIDALRVKDAMAKKRGKDVEPEPFEKDVAHTAESAAIRLIGWTGIDRPWSPEAAIELCTVNPLVFSQVMKESDELGNFTGKK